MPGINRLNRTLSVAIALVALGGLASRAAADVTFGTTYGGAGNSFTANAAGGANFTVAGSGSLSLSSPPIFGTPVGLISADVSLPQQSVAIGLNAAITTTPTGTGAIRMQDAFTLSQQASGPGSIGADGKADTGTSGAGRMHGVVSALDVTLINSQSLGVNSITITGNAELDSFPFNLFGGVDVPLSVTMTPSVLLNNLKYVQIGDAIMGGEFSPAAQPGFPPSKDHPNVPGAKDISSGYLTVISGGTLSGQGQAIVGAVFTADLGVFGDFSTNLGDIELFNEALSETFGLFGSALFRNVPTATSHLDYDDLIFSVNGDISSIIGPLTLPLTLSGSLPISEQFDLPFSLGFLGTLTFRGTFNGNVNYSISGDITLTNLTYNLQSQQIADAVNVPEASSLVLMSLTAVGGAGVVAYRRRRRA